MLQVFVIKMRSLVVWVKVVAVAGVDTTLAPIEVLENYVHPRAPSNEVILYHFNQFVNHALPSCHGSFWNFEI